MNFTGCFQIAHMSACFNFVRWDFSSEMLGAFDWSSRGPFPCHRLIQCSTVVHETGHRQDQTPCR